MTSAGNLGGLAGADAQCQSLATGAGLSGTFKAWLSTSTVDAGTRLGTARGFIRPDGQPFADLVSDITAGRILHPLIIDETGANIGFRNVWTGTAPDGTVIAGSTCLDWTDSTNTKLGGLGFSSAGTFEWTDSSGALSCNNASQHLYCFDTSIVKPLTVSPTTGRIAFATVGNFDTSSGISGADTVCATQATAAGLVGTFKALLSTSSASAASRFNLGAGSLPYVRPDGIKIGDAPTIAAGTALDSGIWQHADGSYDSVAVWTGSTAPNVSGSSMANTCDDWTNATGAASSIIADSPRTDPIWWNWQVNNCNGGASLYCLQQ